MPSASLVSLVAASALLGNLVSAGDGDDGYFGGGVSVPGSGSGDDSKEAKLDEEAEEAKKPRKAIVAPADAYAYGPKNCIKTWLQANRCMIQTDCKEEDIKDYMFHLVCVDRGGEKARHTFGLDSFEPQETFDTLLPCKICTGDKVIDTQLTAQQVTESQDPSQALRQLVGAVREMKEEMKDATVEIKKLNSKVFAEDEASAPEKAKAQPVHFMAQPAQRRSEQGVVSVAEAVPKPNLRRFLEHQRAADAVRARSTRSEQGVMAAADAFHRRAAMHRAAASMSAKIGGERQAHSSKLRRVQREASAKQQRAQGVKVERVAEKAHVKVQEVADAESDAASEDSAEAESAQGADAQAESEQGADARDGEATADDASQEGAEQQESGTEAQDTEESQEDEGSAQAEEGQDSEEAQGQEDAAQEEQSGEQGQEDAAQEEQSGEQEEDAKEEGAQEQDADQA